MAKNKAREDRIKSLVAEILAEEEARGFDGGLENINDIEDEMVRIGDMVAREVGTRRLARHTSRVCEHPRCPDCGSAGEHLGEQTRDLITSRGSVPVTEAKYRCPKCRRHFFPSDGNAGT
jgi:uncharacterized protein with PIN domain